MSDGPENSRGRWWEIPGQGQPDDEGRRELMTDSRGRSRPERSLSAGADLADESRHPSRAYLWPIVSVVVSAGLLLSVIYVVKGKPTPSASALSREPTASGSAQGGVGVRPDGSVTQDAGGKKDSGGKRDAGVKPFASSDSLGGLPAADGSPLPIRRQAGIPNGPVDSAQGRSAPAPNNPAPAPNDSPGGAARDMGNQPTGTTTVSTPAPAPAPTPKLNGSAPPAPGSQQTARPERGTGGHCRIYNKTSMYACDIHEEAPIYLPETMNQDPRGPLPRGTRLFLCQSDGSMYSVGNRTNHWWAWVGSSGHGAWLPVLFLADGAGDGPAGLPICGSSASASTPNMTTSSSPPVEPVEITMIDRKTGRCLDINDEGVVHTLECNDGNSHKLNSPGDGTIRDKKNKRCLDIDVEGKVNARECDKENSQGWHDSVDDGTVRNKQTRRCLDSNDKGDVYALECNGGDSQKWDFTIDR